MARILLFVGCISLFFCAVDACGFINLASTCSLQIPDTSVVTLLLNSTIVESSEILCKSMSRDEFEKLASCAKNDPACAKVIFKQYDPYALSEQFQSIIKDPFIPAPERVKLLYDMLCTAGESCQRFFESIDQNVTADNCSAEGAAIQAETGILLAKYNLSDPNMLTNLTSEEQNTYCGAYGNQITCTLSGIMPPCDAFKNATDKMKLKGTLSQIPPLCANVIDEVIDEALELSDVKEPSPSSSGFIKISSFMLVVTTFGILFNY